MDSKESKVVKADFKKLTEFLKGLQGASHYVVKVGIMGRKNARGDGSGKTNADIGFIHEFGRPRTAHSPEIPQRSFLRMPILQRSDKILKEMDQVRMAKGIAKGGIVEVLGDLGKLCERAILDAFESAGFGSWKANAPSTIRRKAGHTGSTSPLIDFGFLRKSISSEVVKIS